MAKRVVCLGEVMLRLGSPGHQRLAQASSLDVHVAGAEANVAAGLCAFGHQAAMVSALADNVLGDHVVSALRARGVDCSGIARMPGRVGLYFLETGAVQRPSRIVYDRAGSAFALAAPETYDWPALLDGAALLHVSGITPAVGPNASHVARKAVQVAVERGVAVSFDGNYRASLWENWAGDGPGILRELLACASVAFINERDISMILNKKITDRAEAMALAFETFPRLKKIAATRREHASVTHQSLAGEVYTCDHHWVSAEYDLTGIVDRIGGGDAFAAGFLSAELDGQAPRDAINFATCAAVLKHSIPGDLLIARREDVLEMMGTGGLDVRR